MRNIDMELCGDVLIAGLYGELDHSVVSDVRKEIDEAMESCNVRNLILDYSGVTFMDSSGIGLAMGRYRNIKRKNGAIVVIPGSQYVSRILGLSGIFGIIPKSRNRNLALEYMSGKGGMRS